MSGYLSVIVEVPQVQVAHSIHTCKQRGVSGRPHDIINVIRVVLKGVQRLIVLRKDEMWKWFARGFMPNDTCCCCVQLLPKAPNEKKL